MVTTAFNQNAIDPGTAEHLGQELLKETGGSMNLAIVDSLIRMGASLTSVDKNGNTAALLATVRKNEALTEKLLTAGSDPNHTNKQGLFGLASVSFDGPSGTGNPGLARIYIDHNADPEKLFKNISVLAWAARRGFTDVAMVIAEKADIWRQSGDRNIDAMEWAEDNNKPHIATQLRALADQKRDARLKAEFAAEQKAKQEADEYKRTSFNHEIEGGMPTKKAVTAPKVAKFRKPAAPVGQQ